MHSKLSAEHTPSKGHIQELGVNVSLPTLSHLAWSKSLTSGCTPVKSSSLRPVFQVLQRHDINGVSDPYPMPSSRSATNSAVLFQCRTLHFSQIQHKVGHPHWAARKDVTLPSNRLTPYSGGWMIGGKAKVSFSNVMFLLIFVGLPEASRIHLVHASDWPGAAHQYCKVAFEKKNKKGINFVSATRTKVPYKFLTPY